MRKAVFAVLAVLLLFALPTRPRTVLAVDLQSGRGLFENCTANDLAERSLCMGYVLGVLDANGVDPVTRQRGVDIVVKYLQAHPEKLTEPPARLIVAAIK